MGHECILIGLSRKHDLVVLHGAKCRGTRLRLGSDAAWAIVEIQIELWAKKLYVHMILGATTDSTLECSLDLPTCLRGRLGTVRQSHPTPMEVADCKVPSNSGASGV